MSMAHATSQLFGIPGKMQSAGSNRLSSRRATTQTVQASKSPHITVRSFSRQHTTKVKASQDSNSRQPGAHSEQPLLPALLLWAAAELPASAASEFVASAPPAGSYYVSLGLFVLTVPGLWSLIKRSPKAKIKRKTFEVAGPAVQTAMPLDARAKQIFDYFKQYNYSVKKSGETITFEGKYKASAGQAAALVLYTLIGLASTSLVLSIALPFGGNWWYLICAVSPAAGAYYLKNANRTEEFEVKMVTADDDSVTDIVVQGDDEEIERFSRELALVEKGKVYVKGILER